MLTHLRGYLPRRSDYDLRFARQDILAGLTVAFIALPLALGFGVTSGAGAEAGIVTAIVAGVTAAIFGGSRFQISGPTGAMTAVLLPIVAVYGVEALPVLGLIAGAILIGLGLARVGRYVHLIPWPVVTGFTNGIAIVIFLQQAPLVLGVTKGKGESILPVTIATFRNAAAAPHLAPLVLAAVTVLFMVLWQQNRRLRVFPASMAALIAVTLLSLFPAFGSVDRLLGLPAGLPMPRLPDIPPEGWTELVRAAVAIAVLAALESLLSAVVADGMTVGAKHDPDRELFGQGLANVFTAMFGGIPATAALARTAVNVRSGARTRVAGVVHGLAILVIILFLAPLSARIPQAVLGGILIVVAVRMVDRSAAAQIWRATKSDAFVLVLTTIVTVAFDLILAIEVGLVAAAVLFIIRMSRMLRIDPIAVVGRDRDNGKSGEPDAGVDARPLLDGRLVAYRVDGPIFFGAAERFIDQLMKVDPRIRVVVLRLSRVPVLDATGATALLTIADGLEHRGSMLFLSGLQTQPAQVLERMGVLDRLTKDGHHHFETTDAAIEHALAHLSQVDPRAPTRTAQAQLHAEPPAASPEDTG